MDVSPDESGTVKVNGSAAAFYPSVSNITLYSTVILEAVPAIGYAFSGWSGNVTGTANPTFLTVDCDKAVIATFTPLMLMSKLYFPHVTSQGGNSPDRWETEVCLINTGDQALSGMLRSYRQNGQAASSGKAITLAAHERWSRIVGGGEFTNPAEIGYMVFESASDRVVGYTKFYREGIQRTAIPAVREVNGDIHIPHIASDAQWWTRVSLVNTTSATKEFTIAFNNGQSRQLTLDANEHRTFDITSLFDNQPQPDIQSAVITDASGIIGLELFGSNGGGNQMDGLPLTGKTASTLYFPHVAGDEWWTGIVAYNPSELPCTITITPYDAQGTPLTGSTSLLEGKERYVGAFPELGLPAETAWFKIDSAQQPLSGFELFGTVDGNQLAAFAGGGATGAKTGIFPKIEGNGWTGVAFVNTEATAAFVILTAYGDNGIPVADRVLTVSGHAKEIKLAEDLFLRDISGATYIAYASDRDVVGFQLNGSADEMMLDGLPALGGAN